MKLKTIYGLMLCAVLASAPLFAEAKWPFRLKKDAPQTDTGTPVVEKAPPTAFDTPTMWYYDSRMNQKRCLTLKQARRDFLDPRMALKPCPAEKVDKSDRP